MSSDNAKQDLIDVMRTRQGRNVLREILATTGVNKHSFTGQSNQTIFNEGKRSVGVQLINNMVAADSDLYLKLMKEEIES